MAFWENKRIVVTGGSGFLGRHLVQQLKNIPGAQVTSLGSKDYDLTRESEVERLFRETSPQVVFHLAGLVGGILANKERPADFFYQNLMMGTLVMHYASKAGVSKFVAAGAGCGYPEHAPMPLKESTLWDGPPQKESAPYSLAKRMLVVQSAAYAQQHGFKSVVCIPGNIYGEYDNFNLNASHVIPALIRKFVEAKRSQSPTVEVWGSGRPTRDYIYAGDAARGLIKAAEVFENAEVVNLSSGVETSIKEVCSLLQEITGYSGKLVWNTDRPEGQLRRYFDVSRARKDLGFGQLTSLAEGLRRTVEWFTANIESTELRR